MIEPKPKRIFPTPQEKALLIEKVLVLYHEKEVTKRQIAKDLGYSVAYIGKIIMYNDYTPNPSGTLRRFDGTLLQ